MSALDIDYGTDVERSINELVAAIDRSPRVAARFPARWLAITLLDDDRDVAALVRDLPGGTDVTAVAAEQRDRLGDVLGPASLTAIAGARYQWINEVADDVVDRPRSRDPPSPIASIP